MSDVEVMWGGNSHMIAEVRRVLRWQLGGLEEVHVKLAVKLTAVLVVGIVCVMAVYARVQVSNEVRLSEVDAYRARRGELAWLGVIESVWAREGEARARELIGISMQRAAAAGSAGETIGLVSLAPGTPDRPELSAEELAALDAGGIVIRDDPEDEHVYARIRTASQPTAIELVQPHRDERTFVRMSHVAIVGATAAVIAICTLLTGVVQIRLVGHPLARLCDKARRAGAGDLSQPLVLRQRDEMGELADEINTMCDRIAEANRRTAAEAAARVAALEQLRHTDRLATVGQLAAGVAHELGTPLNVISVRAELLAAGRARPSDAAASGRVILEQADRMTGIVQQLLDFSRRRGSKIGLANLDQLVGRTIELVSPAAERANVVVEHEAAGPVFAHVDQNQFQQVLANILMNGIQAMPHGGRLHVSVGTRRVRPAADRSAPEGAYACVTIADEGTGIPRENLAHIFEPFFTTKRVGEGTGLGLAVAHAIVTEHGGWIEADSDVGKGSRFSIFLPQPAERAEAAS